MSRSRQTHIHIYIHIISLSGIGIDSDRHIQLIFNNEHSNSMGKIAYSSNGSGRTINTYTNIS